MLMDWNSRLLGPLALAPEPSAESPQSVSAEADPGVAGTSAQPDAPVPPLAQVIEAWFRDHFTRLWRLVARLGVPSQSIDDVVQDTFITASRRHADIRDGQVWPFLVGTAVRLSANCRSRAAARREVHTDRLDHEASKLPDAEQLLIEKRLRQELERALSTLSDAHRAVFVLYELESFSAPEIAELLALPLGTVRSRLGRARSKFSETAARMQRARLTCPEDS